MSLGLRSYRILTSLLEPFSGIALRQRVAKGKEDADRLPERFGRPKLKRPDGRLVWLHGASVGETALLIDVYDRLRARMPDLCGLFTSQTLTSAALFDRRRPEGAIHQMAPIDAPGAVRRFMSHWKPDAFVLAEGEIWPNLIRRTHLSSVPSALINARMTTKTLKSWNARPAAAREVFDSFTFIGAADEQTARGLRRVSRHVVPTVGNLKQAASAPAVDEGELNHWREALGGRPVLLAASTHAGEEEFSLSAFSTLTAREQAPLLILAPRHPERADQAVTALKAAELTYVQRSVATEVGCDAQVLLADTLGEMGLWMRLADAIYLGGANKQDVGGHNPIEPLKLQKPIFTGPHHYNFDDLMERLKLFSAVKIGKEPQELASFWTTWLDGDGDAASPDWAAISSVFADVEKPLSDTIDAIIDMLVSGADA